MLILLPEMEISAIRSKSDIIKNKSSLEILSVTLDMKSSEASEPYMSLMVLEICRVVMPFAYMGVAANSKCR